MARAVALRLALVMSCAVLVGAPAAVRAQDSSTTAELAARRIAFLLKDAKKGDAVAQWMLGVAYARGNGVPKDEAEAVKWYRLAAAQGSADAQWSLGVAYSDGDGVPKNDAEALKWYRLAAAQGDAGAQFSLGYAYYLGTGVPKDAVQAYKWWNLAAAQGDTSARRNREILEPKMTAAQIAEAQRLSSAFKPVTTTPKTTTRRP